MAKRRPLDPRLDWLYIPTTILGAALIALGIWLDWRDGSPTMSRGDQPLEVVLAGGAGLALFLSGVFGGLRALRVRRASRDDEANPPASV